MAVSKKAYPATPAPEAPAAPEPSCGNCRHYLASVHEGLGLCRRWPPASAVAKATPIGPLMSFPVVESRSLCGEREAPIA